jgi:hypothetical protein
MISTRRFETKDPRKNEMIYRKKMMLPEKFSLNTSGLLTSGVQYNTVEGVNASLKVDMTKRYEDHRYHNLSASARYGFSNYLWGGTANWKYLMRQEKFESINVKVDRDHLASP